MENEYFKKMLSLNIQKKQMLCTKHGPVMADVLITDAGEDKWTCPECEKEYEIVHAAELEKMHRKSEIANYSASNIESEYWDKTLDDFKPVTDSQRRALEAVKSMIENHSGKVILLGSNGVGKTMLGSCAVKILGGKILSMYEISTMIRQSYTNRAEKSELEIVKELAEIPFLVIDELGRTKGSDAELNWLSYVLDKRHTRNKPFMLLSNTHLSRDCPNHGCPQCFENYLGNDILSRLRQNSKLIKVDGPDNRAVK